MLFRSLNFRRDLTIYDGRYANNGWLQELPKPMSKMAWDTAAHIAPATAEANHLKNGDLITITHEGRSMRFPVWVMPGHAKDSLTVTLGYGRTHAGRLGNAQGFNAYELRGSAAPHVGAATMAKANDTYDLVVTQEHWAIEGRNLVRSATLEEFKENPAFVKGMEHGVPKDGRISLYPDKEYRGQQWGMAIDMNTCTGCMACVVACVAENNIVWCGAVTWRMIHSTCGMKPSSAMRSASSMATHWIAERSHSLDFIRSMRRSGVATMISAPLSIWVTCLWRSAPP